MCILDNSITDNTTKVLYYHLAKEHIIELLSADGGSNSITGYTPTLMSKYLKFCHRNLHWQESNIYIFEVSKHSPDSSVLICNYQLPVCFMSTCLHAGNFAWFLGPYFRVLKQTAVKVKELLLLVCPLHLVPKSAEAILTACPSCFSLL